MADLEPLHTGASDAAGDMILDHAGLSPRELLALSSRLREVALLRHDDEED